MNFELVAKARRAFGAAIDRCGKCVPYLGHEKSRAPALDAGHVNMFGVERNLAKLTLQPLGRRRVCHDAIEIGARAVELQLAAYRIAMTALFFPLRRFSGRKHEHAFGAVDLEAV